MCGIHLTQDVEANFFKGFHKQCTVSSLIWHFHHIKGNYNLKYTAIYDRNCGNFVKAVNLRIFACGKIIKNPCLDSWRLTSWRLKTEGWILNILVQSFGQYWQRCCDWVPCEQVPERLSAIDDQVPRRPRALWRPRAQWPKINSNQTDFKMRLG